MRASSRIEALQILTEKALQSISIVCSRFGPQHRVAESQLRRLCCPDRSFVHIDLLIIDANLKDSGISFRWISGEFPAEFRWISTGGICNERK